MTPLAQSKLPILKLQLMGLHSKLSDGHRFIVSYLSSYPLGERGLGLRERRLYSVKGEGPRLAAIAASPAAMAASLMDPLAVRRTSADPAREAREPGREATGDRLRPRLLVITPGDGERRL